MTGLGPGEATGINDAGLTGAGDIADGTPTATINP